MRDGGKTQCYSAKVSYGSPTLMFVQIFSPVSVSTTCGSGGRWLVHPAVPDKLAKYLEIFDAPIVMHFASWWGSTREALRKLGLRHLQKDQ